LEGRTILEEGGERGREVDLRREESIQGANTGVRSGKKKKTKNEKERRENNKLGTITIAQSPHGEKKVRGKDLQLCWGGGGGGGGGKKLGKKGHSTKTLAQRALGVGQKRLKAPIWTPSKKNLSQTGRKGKIKRGTRNRKGGKNFTANLCQIPEWRGTGGPRSYEGLKREKDCGKKITA